MTFEGGWGPDNSGQYPGQVGRQYNERLDQAAQNAGPPEPSLMDTSFNMVLSLAAKYFVVAVIANFALYDTGKVTRLIALEPDGEMMRRGRARLQLDNWRSLLKDFTAAIKDKVVMRGLEGESD